MRFPFFKPVLIKTAVETSGYSPIKTAVEKAVIRGRCLLRTFLPRSRYKTGNEIVKLESFYESSSNTASLSCAKRVQSRIKILRACYFYKRLFQRAVTKWASNSLAAVIRRNAAKKLMYLGSPNVPLLGFVGFCLAKGPTLLTDEQESEILCWEIRDAISRVPWTSSGQTSINITNSAAKAVTLEDFEIGTFLAKGCSAAVYSACWKQFKLSNFSGYESNNISVSTPFTSEKQDLEMESHLIQDPVCCETTTHPSLIVGPLAPYDLAVKMMFNYEIESNAAAIWKAMCKEIIPARHSFKSVQNYYRIRWKRKKLPPHPGIVEMYCAFADWVPSFPEAVNTYPHALPVRLNHDGCGRNMTLFLIMKRYHCSLNQYLDNHQPTIHTSLLLLTQLLEGIVHLSQHQMAHRDLKLDNILVDLTYGVSNPMLAITDFGCCLESLHMAFPTEEVDKGGNVALMAPEVLGAEPGPFSVIDYSRADLWTVGTMAYEIFGAQNPFYCTSSSHCCSNTYTENDLPELPSDVPPVLSRLIKDILNRNSKKRPSPSLAATVCQILLHGTPDLFTQNTDSLYKNVLKWLTTLTAVTVFQSKFENKEKKFCPLELQLRHTFLSRIQLSEILDALQYIKSD